MERKAVDREPAVVVAVIRAVGEWAAWVVLWRRDHKATVFAHNAGIASRIYWV